MIFTGDCDNPCFPPVLGLLYFSIWRSPGQIFVAGGVAIITACHFYTLQPGRSMDEMSYPSIYQVRSDLMGGFVSTNSMDVLLGVLLREFYVLGGDILVGAGVLIFTASTISNTQLFLNGKACTTTTATTSVYPPDLPMIIVCLYVYIGGGAGFMLAQLAGVMVCSAVAFLLNTGAIHASGAGTSTIHGGQQHNPTKGGKRKFMVVVNCCWLYLSI